MIDAEADAIPVANANVSSVGSQSENMTDASLNHGNSETSVKART